MENVMSDMEAVLIDEMSIIPWKDEHEFWQAYPTCVTKPPLSHYTQTATESAFSMSAKGVTIESAGRSPNRSESPIAMPWCLLGYDPSKIRDMVIDFEIDIRTASGHTVPERNELALRFGFLMDPNHRVPSHKTIKESRVFDSRTTTMVHFPKVAFMSEVTALIDL
jgi:hypothetical protein